MRSQPRPPREIRGDLGATISSPIPKHASVSAQSAALSPTMPATPAGVPAIRQPNHPAAPASGHDLRAQQARRRTQCSCVTSEAEVERSADDSHDSDEAADPHHDAPRTACAEQAPGREDDGQETVAAPLQIPGGGVGSQRRRSSSQLNCAPSTVMECPNATCDACVFPAMIGNAALFTSA